ncbi:MAG: ribonuclease P protein component [Patescibacteria group bacterium]
MLPRKNRLRLQKDFTYIFKKGRTINSSALLIKSIKTQAPNNRFGIIISNKISKKAVERNKIRRRIKSWINKNQTKIKKGFDIIIITKKNILNYSYLETEQELLQMFKKTGLIK